LNEQRQSLIRTIYSALKNGEITRGDQIFSERELIEKFGVKRGLLREALLCLDAFGIIEIRERQGMFLSKNGPESLASGLEFLSANSPIEIMEQTFEVRLMMETQGAALAAERRSEHAALLIRAERDLYEKLMTQDHPSRATLGFQHNQILHNIIMEAAGNQVLHEASRGVLTLYRNAFSVLGSNNLRFQPYALWFDVLAQEHINIADAVIEKDRDRAYYAMNLHLRNSMERNKRTLSKAPLLLFDDNFNEKTSEKETVPDETTYGFLLNQ